MAREVRVERDGRGDDKLEHVVDVAEPQRDAPGRMTWDGIWDGTDAERARARTGAQSVVPARKSPKISSTPPRGSYLAQSQVLGDIKRFDAAALRPTQTVVTRLDGTRRVEGGRAAARAAEDVSLGDDDERRRLSLPSEADMVTPPESPTATPASLPTSPAHARGRAATDSRAAAADPRVVGADGPAPRRVQGRAGSRALAHWRRGCPPLKALRDDEVSEVAPGVFVGGVGGAKNLTRLRACGVTHVVNASPVLPCFYKEHFQYLVLDLYDSCSESASQFFQDSNAFMANALGEGREGAKAAVFVHCYAGVSRSATLVAAFLMAHRGMTLAEAMATLKRARPGVGPNAGFMQQLAKYEREIASGGAGAATGTEAEPGGPCVKDVLEDRLFHMEIT